LLHAPQLAGSVMTSAHTPLQAVVPAGQAQWPETHAAPTGHAMPHAPQLFGSWVVSTQPFGQLVSPIPQTQAVTGGAPKVWHIAPAPHTTPHEPQLELSLVRSTQAPPQVVGLSGGQPQTPEVQTPLTRQAMPHWPQSEELFERLWQPSGQVTVPEGQVQAGGIPVQTAPGAHFVPHAPQLAGSVMTSVQTELHWSGLAAGHAHAPLLHVAPWAHGIPHPPQLFVSVVGSMHVVEPLHTRHRSGVRARSGMA
jgi:hypothetical protein